MTKDTYVLLCVPAGTGFQGGGVVSTYMHYRALLESGYNVRVLRVGHYTSKKVIVHDTVPLPYQLVTIKDAVKICTYVKHPALISQCCIPKFGVEEIIRLMEVGAKLVLRRTPDMGGPITDFIKTTGARAVVIRESIGKRLKEKHGVPYDFIPHFYMPTFKRIPKWKGRPANAVALSRVYYCKHTHDIAAANQMLPPSKRCRIYGFADRRYVHWTLDEKHPGWQEDYYGGFKEGTGAHIAATARMVVDLTHFPKDGGGTQRTFFEAWDAGALLVLPSSWGEGDGIRAGDNAYFADDVAGLRDILKYGSSDSVVRHMRKAGREKMEAHGAASVLPIYFKALRR